MTPQPLEAVQYRLAQHYIGKLRQANMALQRDRQNAHRWYQAVEQDWAQIRSWQQWAARDSDTDIQKARLCVAFGTHGHEYTTIRQSPAERLVWGRAALKAAQIAGDTESESDLLYEVGTTAYQTAAFDEAEECAARLLEIGRRTKHKLSLGYGWFITGNLHSHRTQLDAAEAAFRKAVTYFEATRTMMMVGHATQGLARIALFRGRYQDALEYAARYLSIIQRHGREADFSLAFHTLSNIHTRLGNLAQAKDFALKAVDNSRRLGFVRMLPSNLLILGYAELALEEWDSAWEHFQESIRGTQATSQRFELTAATYSLGDIRLRQNQLDAAMDYFQQALEIAAVTHILAYVSLCNIQMAYIHALQGQHVAARTALHEGAVASLETASDILLAKTLIPAAQLWLGTGDAEQAARWVGLLDLHPEHAESKLVAGLAQTLKSALGEPAYQAAYESGRQISLKDAVTQLIPRLIAVPDTRSAPHTPRS